MFLVCCSRVVHSALYVQSLLALIYTGKCLHSKGVRSVLVDVNVLSTKFSTKTLLVLSNISYLVIVSDAHTSFLVTVSCCAVLLV